VKAIATHGGLDPSAVAELVISQVATPTIQNNCSNAVSITTETVGATIYYTTDGSTPTTSSTEYTVPLTENISNVTIKAIAVKEGMITSIVGSNAVILQCAEPVIARSGNNSFTISCSFPASDVTIYYTTNGTTPTTSSTRYTAPFNTPAGTTVKAIAVKNTFYNTIAGISIDNDPTPSVATLSTTIPNATIYYIVTDDESTQFTYTDGVPTNGTLYDPANKPTLYPTYGEIIKAVAISSLHQTSLPATAKRNP
jgi:hypothetical protein